MIVDVANGRWLPVESKKGRPARANLPFDLLSQERRS
jgi:hypothetical protein